MAEAYLRKLKKVCNFNNKDQLQVKFEKKEINICLGGYISRDAITTALHYYDFTVKEKSPYVRKFNISQKIKKYDFYYS